MPHDNESGLRWLLPEFVATAEVLRGLGIVEGDTATFAFADGTEATLEPVGAGEVASTLGGAPAPPPTEHDPVWLRNVDDRCRLLRGPRSGARAGARPSLSG